jgi:malto-oligosyltrehalose trehalohydrolase
MSQKRFGHLLTEAGVEFRLWAPAAGRVDLVLDRPIEMTPKDGGWFEAHVNDLAPGARYRFRIDDRFEVPDPASAFQPEDVFGPSEVIDHRTYAWRVTDWRGRPWHETVILEAHIGTFTSEGTFRAAIDRLDQLVDSGITALELMPLADFAGQRNWGYDGVLWCAPDSAYGRPDDLKSLIDSAHQRGLMVFLDVVYNHFGPEGNYLGRYAPEFFTKAQTPWGGAIDFSVPEVRALAIDSAIGWLRDYRFDGLRLDAIHAFVEPGKAALLRELSVAVGELSTSNSRHIHLMLENDDNSADLLDPCEAVPRGKYRAQWNDDYHHAWHVLLTGETHGYFRDYRKAPVQHIVRALNSGFVYQGEPSEHRGGRPRGQPSGELSPLAFINFLQNHDQIGNRAIGDRLAASIAPQVLEAALAITLIAPFVPMLFMGEEWGSTRPFPFFCDFEGDLAERVRSGRKKEFAAAYAKYGEEIPDPLDVKTLQLACLDWSTAATDFGKRRLDLVRELLAVRRREIVPRLVGVRFATAHSTASGLLTANWPLGDGSILSLAANLSDHDLAVLDPGRGTLIWGRELNGCLPPWTVSWRIE